MGQLVEQQGLADRWSSSAKNRSGRITRARPGKAHNMGDTRPGPPPYPRTSPAARARFARFHRDLLELPGGTRIRHPQQRWKRPIAPSRQDEPHQRTHGPTGCDQSSRAQRGKAGPESYGSRSSHFLTKANAKRADRPLRSRFGTAVRLSISGIAPRGGSPRRGTSACGQPRRFSRREQGNPGLQIGGVRSFKSTSTQRA